MMMNWQKDDNNINNDDDEIDDDDDDDDVDVHNDNLEEMKNDNDNIII